MPLSYHPSPGEIVLCRYPRDMVASEIGKTRPVVVIGPRLRRRGGIATIVPLSTTCPEPLEPFQRRLELDQPLPPPYDSPVMWAKCDFVSSVALDRLDRFKVGGGHHGGPRQYRTGKVTADQLHELKVALLCGLGFDSLTIHL